MSELVGRAKASLEGVTEGPWETRPGATGDPTTTSASVHSGHRSILVSSDGYHFGYADKADARFIAAARQLVPELIAEVEQERESHLETAAIMRRTRERAYQLQGEVEHWKSLWQGTVEDSTKVIQERDEALREVEALKKRAIPETVTRIDMIDPKRQEHWSDYWSVSIQDEGRTLKLFAEGDGSAAREERDAALAKTISEDLRRLRGTNE